MNEQQAFHAWLISDENKNGCWGLSGLEIDQMLVAWQARAMLSSLPPERIKLEHPIMNESTPERITELALANGFKLKEQPDGGMALNPYVFGFAAELQKEIMAQCLELAAVPPDINKALVIIAEELFRLKDASFAALKAVDLLQAAFATPQGIPALLERERCAMVAERGFRFAKDGYEIADEIRLGPNETTWSTL